jgi:hypothetical protein
MKKGNADEVSTEWRVQIHALSNLPEVEVPHLRRALMYCVRNLITLGNAQSKLKIKNKILAENCCACFGIE